MSGDNECIVTSEISPFFVKDTTNMPLLDDKNVVSKFSFFIPVLEKYSDKSTKNLPMKDEDGDYVLQRKSSAAKHDLTITLEHKISTEIKFVGLQIWRAALLLADFVIHSQKLFKGRTVLELGSGVGLTSVVTAMFAKKIICTDLDVGNILKLVKSNLKRNEKLLISETIVDELNFFNSNWSDTIAQNINLVEIVLAADVIYDNDVTEAFVRTITNILSCPPKKTLYIGLEKRYVFTINDLDSLAPCFEHFKDCLESVQSKPPFSKLKVTELPIDFPQYFNYERTKELTLLEISSV